MRLFYIENEVGARIPLNDEDGIFLYQPTGLGISFSNDYSESGDGFFFRTKAKDSRTSPNFTLIFTGHSTESPYERYRSFLGWAMPAKELFLIYKPYGTREFYKKIDIERIDKGELDEYGMLRCSTSFTPLTPWYLPVPLHVDFGEEDPNAMEYDFVYDEDPDTYLIYAVGSKDYSAEISASGHIDGALLITYSGYALNPEFQLMGLATRTIYGTCKVEGEIESGEKLILSTAEQDSYIKKIDANGNEIDLLDSIDITTNPFFRVPLSEPCEVSISGESLLGTAEMKLYSYYRGV